MSESTKRNSSFEGPVGQALQANSSATAAEAIPDQPRRETAHGAQEESRPRAGRGGHEVRLPESLTRDWRPSEGLAPPRSRSFFGAFCFLSSSNDLSVSFSARVPARNAPTQRTDWSRRTTPACRTRFGSLPREKAAGAAIWIKSW